LGVSSSPAEDFVQNRRRKFRTSLEVRSRQYRRTQRFERWLSSFQIAWLIFFKLY
jgi:hypothetical protein